MLYIISLIIVILDQITKYIAINNLKGKPSIILIKKHLEFTYVENMGAAFGILEGKRLFFIVLTIVVIGVIMFTTIRYYKELDFITKLGVGLLLGGAIGNFIDRFRFGYVVDFIRLGFGGLYDFPVFNIADMSVVFATIVIFYIILFKK